MNYLSTNNNSPAVSFKEALLSGIAPDGGLYVPERLPKLSASFLDNIEKYSLQEIGTEIASRFIDEIPRADLQEIISKSLTFPIPLVHLEGTMYLLELFHGPTLAFKDVGARFMAETLSYFLRKEKKEVTIIVATSGDTGSAVAHGFFNVPNISVCVLYPSGKVSPLQEKQMTTLGGNIRAIEVEGTFDDCQKLVKQTLASPEILSRRTLTTANSINISRLIPQMMYYCWAITQYKKNGTTAAKHNEVTVVVPSGNFGNLTAAVYAKWLGAPIQHFIAATNANDVVPEYFSTGIFTPRPSVQTYSNAMDVGNPSNLARLLSLYGNNLKSIQHDITALRVSDEETLKEICNTFETTGYILDPHTAVGVCAARKVAGDTIIASTAHYGKFPEVVEKALGKPVTLPPVLQQMLHKQKQSAKIHVDFDELKSLLLA